MGKSLNLEKSPHSDFKTGLQCQHCGKKFKYESEKKRHEQSHTPQFACKICSKKFSFMSALKRHEKQHGRTGSVNCDECNRKFRDESLLKRHIQYAHKGKFVCDKCNTVFSSDLALRSHMKTHNPESERKFRCSFDGCKKTFNFAHHLKHHELTHTNTKQHFCCICGKGFIQYHHLKSHLKRHTPERCLQCSATSCKHNISTPACNMKKQIAPHDNSNDIDVNDKNISKPDTSRKGSSFDIGFEMQDLKLQSKCPEDEENTYNVNDLYTTNLMRVDETDTLTAAEPVSISSCSSYLGGCIMESGGNRIQNCVCAQISCPIEDTYDIVAKKIFNTSNKTKMKQNNTKYKPVKIEKGNECGNCDCKNHNELKQSSIRKSSNYVDHDVIEYKSDGTIKLKESSDIAFEVELKTQDNSSKGILTDTIPFNSCKDVLGKCIVSGNGTIGEGCLCAKMAVDDQPIIEQEIDELTPCPKTY